jgi:zinc protease
LQRVAREYLTTNNRTLYALLPKGASPKVSVTGVETGDSAIQKFQLPNGLRLLVKENHRLPFVQIRAAFKGGVLAENAANNGLTQLTAKLIIKGTRTRSAEDIAREIESVGGSLDGFGGNNSFGVSAEVMSSDLKLGLDLVTDVLLNPIFPPAALERERQITLAGIKAQRDNLLKSGGNAMRRAMFGEIGYGLDALGSEASVQKLQTDDLADFHRNFAVPNNCVLAVYGDVQAKDVHVAVEKYFGNWRPGAQALANLPVAVPLAETKRVLDMRDKKQAVLLIGYTGTTVQSADRYALELLQEACSDLGSRLFLRIREKLGLAYYVGAQNSLGLAPGYFAFYVGTAPEKVELVEKELLEEAALLRSEGLTAEELKRAKAKIIGQKKIGRQDLGGLATATALDELFGLGYAHSEQDDARYEAVTLDDIKAAAKKYLRDDAKVISIVRPQ